MLGKHKNLLTSIVIFIIYLLISYYWASHFFMMLLQNELRQISEDQLVFEFIGKAWALYGKIPFRDYFDHKGPVIYLFFALGYLMTKTSFGVLLISALWTAICMYITYKIICETSLFEKEVYNKILAFLLSLVFNLWFLYLIRACGITVGQVSMPFILGCTWILVIIYKNDFNIKLRYHYIYGALCALPVLSRATDAIFIFLAYICLWCVSIRKENIVQRLKEAGVTILGGLTPYSIFALYFAIHCAFKEFMDCTFFLNIKYATGNVVSMRAYSTLDGSNDSIPGIVVLIMLLFLAIRKINNKEKFSKHTLIKLTILFICYILQANLYVKSSRYIHYSTPLICTLPLFFDILLYDVRVKIKKQSIIVTISSLVMILTVLMLNSKSLYFINTIYKCGGIIGCKLGYFTNENAEINNSLDNMLEVTHELDFNKVNNAINKAADRIKEKDEPYIVISSSEILDKVMTEDIKIPDCKYIVYQKWHLYVKVLTLDDFIGDLDKNNINTLYIIQTMYSDYFDIDPRYKKVDFYSFGIDKCPEVGVHIYEKEE